MSFTPEPLLLTPQYRDYVWGGDRLRPGHAPTAEAWVVYAEDLITAGSLFGQTLAGQTLAKAAAAHGEALLGKRAIAQTGLRFPLLVKLLDCAAWLSLQVHPNDQQAQRLEGPGFFGKTEAWHFIGAEQGSEILCGLRPGTQPSELEAAIRSGTLLDLMQRLPVTPGSSIYIAPGTIHALGPGLLVYEVQQTSDVTYRVYDWGRPATGDRPLHIDKSLVVSNPAARGDLLPPPPLPDGGCQTLVTCPYFTLELLSAQQNSIDLDTRRESFHAITLISGRALLEGAGWSLHLERFATAVIPAACGAYTFNPDGPCQALKSSV